MLSGSVERNFCRLCFTMSSFAAAAVVATDKVDFAGGAPASAPSRAEPNPLAALTVGGTLVPQVVVEADTPPAASIEGAQEHDELKSSLLT